MTRTVFWSATSAFWIVVIGLWIGSLGQSASRQNPVTAAEPRIALNQIVRHASAVDCWMAIRGAVYDLSAYIAEHPTRPDIITVWCGKEATDAYNTKTRGRAHSPHADELLAKHRIGALDTAAQ